MTCLKGYLPASQTLPSFLNLLQPLGGQAVHEYEHVSISKLALASGYLFAVYVSPATARAVSRPDDAGIAYASWLSDIGALEVASWVPNIRSAVR